MVNGASAGNLNFVEIDHGLKMVRNSKKSTVSIKSIESQVASPEITPQTSHKEDIPKQDSGNESHEFELLDQENRSELIEYEDQATTATDTLRNMILQAPPPVIPPKSGSVTKLKLTSNSPLPDNLPNIASFSKPSYNSLSFNIPSSIPIQQLSTPSISNSFNTTALGPRTQSQTLLPSIHEETGPDETENLFRVNKIREKSFTGNTCLSTAGQQFFMESSAKSPSDHFDPLTLKVEFPKSDSRQQMFKNSGFPKPENKLTNFFHKTFKRSIPVAIQEPPQRGVRYCHSSQLNPCRLNPSQLSSSQFNCNKLNSSQFNSSQSTSSQAYPSPQLGFKNTVCDNPNYEHFNQEATVNQKRSRKNSGKGFKMELNSEELKDITIEFLEEAIEKYMPEEPVLVSYQFMKKYQDMIDEHVAVIGKNVFAESPMSGRNYIKV